MCCLIRRRHKIHKKIIHIAANVGIYIIRGGSILFIGKHFFWIEEIISE